MPHHSYHTFSLAFQSRKNFHRFIVELKVFTESILRHGEQFDGFEDHIAKMQVKILSNLFYFLLVFIRKRFAKIFVHYFFSITENMVHQKIQSVTLKMQKP